MDIFLLYLFTRVDFLINSLIVLAVFSGVAAVLSVLIWADTIYEDKRVFWSKKAKMFVWFVLFFWSLALIIPSQKSLAIIAGGYLAFEAVNHPVVSETASKLNTIIQHQLNEQIKEIEQKQK